MKTLLVLIMLLFNCAHAEDSLIIHGVSYHPQVRTYNEINTGIGYRKYKDNVFLTIGTYKNSLSNQSVYAGIGYKITDNFNVIGGYITGYPNSNNIIIPELSVNITKHTRLNVMYIPYIKNVVDEVIGFSIEIK